MKGEEIGMTNNMNISFEETQDPSGIRCGPDHYQECSRDPVRTPFQWSAEDETAGFSTNSTAHTWLPVNSDYMEGINVKVSIANFHNLFPRCFLFFYTTEVLSTITLYTLFIGPNR